MVEGAGSSRKKAGGSPNGMALVSKTSGSNPLQVQVLYPPPNETCSELRKRSDFAEAKIALSIFSKPFPPTAEAVNSQSSPQLHESVLSLRVGLEPIFWKNSFHAK